MKMAGKITQDNVRDVLESLKDGEVVEFSGHIKVPLDLAARIYLWVCRDLPTRAMRLASGYRAPIRKDG